jgi:hypothetical protein
VSLEDIFVEFVLIGVKLLLNYRNKLSDLVFVWIARDRLFGRLPESFQNIFCKNKE